MPPESNDPTQQPVQWPGAFGIYKHSKNAVRLILGALIALMLINIVASILLELIFPGSENSAGLASLIVNVLGFIISAVTTIAIADLVLTATNDEKLSLKQSFRKVPALWLRMVGLTLLFGFLAFFSLLALIIPFFFVLPRILLAPYFLVDRQLGAVEALRASWSETKGHSGKVWGIVGANILMILLVFTIIGIPFAIYFLIMYSAAYAILYRYINGKPVVSVNNTGYSVEPTSNTTATPSDGIPPQAEGQPPTNEDLPPSSTSTV